jgi:hypothetical protein
VWPVAVAWTARNHTATEATDFGCAGHLFVGPANVDVFPYNVELVTLSNWTQMYLSLCLLWTLFGSCLQNVVADQVPSGVAAFQA